MSNRVLTAEAEILEPSDFDRMTLFPQQAIDGLIADAIAYPAHWAGFTVSSTANAQEVRVSAGRYFNGEIVYELGAEIDVSLLPYLPTITSDEHWVALILRGATVTLVDDRPFETSHDPETSVPVVRSTPKVESRQLSIVVQQGLKAPAPALKPTVAETDCCIAFVRLTSSGVREIVPGESWRVRSLYEVEGRVTAIEVNLASLFLRTTTLETDLANLNALVRSLPVPRPEIILQMRRDIAAMRRADNVPTGARSDWYDPGLIIDKWDPTHTQWLARIDEGVQFPYANEKEARLELKVEDDPRIRFAGRRMMPTWTDAKRIENWGSGGSRDISQQVHTVVNAIQRSVSRTKVSYGPTINVCVNMAEWANYGDQLNSQKNFTRNGETFENLGVSYRDPVAPNHVGYAVRTVKTRSYTDTYWDYVTEEFGVNGSVYGQTFLVAQPMIATALELDVTRVGADGEIHLFLCETDATGAPLVEKVLANATIERADLRVGVNRFTFAPTFLTPGKRYAWFTVTVGNHQLRGTNSNAFTGGTSFRLTDGAWAQGDAEFDFNFRLYAARFAAARTVLEFKGLNLDNGMTELSLLYANWAPDGTAIEWEIRPSGLPDWSKLEAVAINPLVGLPANVELRCTFLSTPDLAPMIVLDASAVAHTARIRPECRAISDPINFGLTTTTVQTMTVLDDFDPAVHAFSPRIIVGATGQSLLAPDVTTVKIDDDKPSRRSILSTYTVPAGTNVVRNAPGMTTANVANPCFMQNAALFAL